MIFRLLIWQMPPARRKMRVCTSPGIFRSPASCQSIPQSTVRRAGQGSFAITVPRSGQVGRSKHGSALRLDDTGGSTAMRSTVGCFLPVKLPKGRDSPVHGLPGASVLQPDDDGADEAGSVGHASTCCRLGAGVGREDGDVSLVGLDLAEAPRRKCRLVQGPT